MTGTRAPALTTDAPFCPHCRGTIRAQLYRAFWDGAVAALKAGAVPGNPYGDDWSGAGFGITYPGDDTAAGTPATTPPSGTHDPGGGPRAWPPYRDVDVIAGFLERDGLGDVGSAADLVGLLHDHGYRIVRAPAGDPTSESPAGGQNPHPDPATEAPGEALPAPDLPGPAVPGGGAAPDRLDRPGLTASGPDPLREQITMALRAHVWVLSDHRIAQVADAVLPVLTAAITAARKEYDRREVLVEDSFFARGDLPKILGHFMRTVDVYGEAAKDAWLRAQAAEARIAAVEAVVDLDSEDWSARSARELHARIRAALAGPPAAHPYVPAAVVLDSANGGNLPAAPGRCVSCGAALTDRYRASGVCQNCTGTTDDPRFGAPAPGPGDSAPPAAHEFEPNGWRGRGPTVNDVEQVCGWRTSFAEKPCDRWADDPIHSFAGFAGAKPDSDAKPAAVVAMLSRRKYDVRETPAGWVVTALDGQAGGWGTPAACSRCAGHGWIGTGYGTGDHDHCPCLATCRLCAAGRAAP